MDVSIEKKDRTTTSVRGVENRAKHPCQLNKPYKGIHMNKWGKWVAEIRDSVLNRRIWLGSYDTPMAAARAYDVALFYLHGPDVKLNFPELVVGDGQHYRLSLNEVWNRAIEVGLKVDALQVQMRLKTTPSSDMSLGLIDRELDVYITPNVNKCSEMSLNPINRDSNVYITPDLNKCPQMSLNPINHESDVYITPDLNKCLEMNLHMINRDSDVSITLDLNKSPQMSLSLINHESDVYITPDLNKYPQLES